MAHEWIIEMLTDLRDYARLNGLAMLAQKTEETLQVARAEVAARLISPEGLRTAAHGSAKPQ